MTPKQINKEQLKQALAKKTADKKLNKTSDIATAIERRVDAKAAEAVVVQQLKTAEVKAEKQLKTAETKVEKQLKTAEVKAEKKLKEFIKKSTPKKERKPSMSSVAAKMIADGASNEDVNTQLHNQFGLDLETKSHYAGWFRSRLVRQGKVSKTFAADHRHDVSCAKEGR